MLDTLIDRLKLAAADESGAVTVDWVVLTASIIALNIGLIVGLFESGLNLGASAIYEDLVNPLD
ncbi:MAG: hypothetical protein AAGI50_18020 [Pseudomonadota bacterium]